MEEWRKIDNGGRYEISNLGNVRSYVNYHGNIVARPHVLKPHKGNNGYLMVMLYLGNKTSYVLIHRLVAQAFIPNPNKFRCVNHKDENRHNNNVNNLEWCSHKYNNNYGTRNKKLAQSLTNNPNFTKAVYQLNKQNEIINEFPSIKEAAKYVGCTPAQISRVCLGCLYRQTAHGYGWKFKQN